MTYIKKSIKKYLGITIYTRLKYGIALVVSVALVSTTFAQLSKTDIKELIRQRNSSITEQQVEVTIPEQCLGIQEVEIIPYMYHYIRPVERDPTYSVISQNSITPDMARDHFSRLGDLQQNTDTRTILTSELQQYQDSNCFPQARNILLIFDDGRRDNYHYLRSLAQEFDIKAHIGIIVNRVSRTDRIDPFMMGHEIQEMSNSKHFEILSHSWTHTDLRKKNRDSQHKEICQSKTRLEEAFGVSINTFVYPMGLYNATSTHIASNCGYRYAFTTHTRHTNIHAELSAYPMELSRVRTQKRNNGYTTFPFSD